jgi:hypothetical protein
MCLSCARRGEARFSEWRLASSAKAVSLLAASRRQQSMASLLLGRDWRTHLRSHVMESWPGRLGEEEAQTRGYGANYVLCQQDERQTKDTCFETKMLRKHRRLLVPASSQHAASPKLAVLHQIVHGGVRKAFDFPTR